MSNQPGAIIIGHGPGIGAAMAEALVSEGFAVALIARSAEKVESAAAMIRSRGGTAHGIAADASDLGALDQAIAAAAAALGTVELLHYNAAHWRPGPVLATTLAGFEEDFRTCVGGALLAARAVAPAMIARGAGTLLFTGGGLALYPSAEAPSLSIGKAGIRSLALMLAQELAPHGVRVGTVTVMGQVLPGTALAPERVAEAFLSLHRMPPDPATTELVFNG